MKKSLIALHNTLPGIVGLLVEFPVEGKVLSELAQTILRKESSLPVWFREFVAAGVSAENRTQFCGRSHMAAACAVSGKTKEELFDIVGADPKLAELFELAVIVGYNGETAGRIERLKEDHQATDEEIHDVVLIASAFAMYNRYVKCLGADKPELSVEDYEQIGISLAKEQGYIMGKPEPELV